MNETCVPYAAREWVLTEQTHAFIRSKKWEVAVLPTAATEPHNLHMPYGTDIFEARAVAEEACRIAYSQGGMTLCLPPLPFGVNTNHFKVPGGLACGILPSTLMAVVADIVDSLERQGIHKIVILNGHGGNEIKPIIRELHHRSAAFICCCDFWRAGLDKRDAIFERPGDHADELESSLGYALFPEFMRPLSEADDGRVAPTKFEALNKGWAQFTRPWHLATTGTGTGDPSKATADKGRAFFELVTGRIGQFLLELAREPFNENFPYESGPPQA